MIHEYKVSEVVELWRDGVKIGVMDIHELARHASRLHEENRAGSEAFSGLCGRINKALEFIMSQGPPRILDQKIIAILEGKE